ncbi:MAG: hypothetical protein WBX15_19300 [Thermoanaerobaculia bacterium]
MNRLIRLTAALLIAAAGVMAVYRVGYLPYECNILKKEVDVETRRGLGYGMAAILLSRQNLPRIEACLRCSRTDAGLWVLKGANEVMSGNRDAAIASFESAFRYRHQPEILVNLGNLHLQEGKRELAMEEFVRAVRFQPSLLNDVHPSERAEVRKRVEEPRG